MGGDGDPAGGLPRDRDLREQAQKVEGDIKDA
jgi:hypothetical protein